MQKIKITVPEIKLVGLKTRTSNKDEAPGSQTEKISATVGRFFQEQLAKSIQYRKEPGVTYCVYTEFESDETGPYTFFVGEQVEKIGLLHDELVAITIPEQTYVRFTFGPGSFPQTLIDAWGSIWKMSEKDFGGKRAYRADFERYDERAGDFSNPVFDIYLGLKK